MYGPLKLSHHSHTGKRRPHEHTSYLPLALMVLLTGVILALFTLNSAHADTPYTTPGAGSIGLTGVMPGPPPNVAAIITSPANGQHFTSSPVTVKGTCPDNDLVEIFKNDIFAGSAICSNGAFSVQIQPLFGKNSLTAQVFDSLNQSGPMSKAVIIYYDYSVSPAAPTSFLNFTGSQLILETDAVFRGSFPKQQMNVPVTVIGGTAPFAINVQWGDDSNSVIARGNNTTFNASHAYSQPGTYKITLQGTDSKNLVAFLTVAAIINGQPAGVSASVNSPKSMNKYFVLWPLLAIAATAVLSFWIGERREKKIMRKLQPPATPAFGSAPPPPPPAPAASA